MKLAVKLAPISSRVCEMETTRRSHKRHLQSIKLAKPQIDVTQPAVPKRIQRYDMNSARNRRLQTLIDEEKINLLTDIYIQNIRNSPSFHDTNLLQESPRLIRRSSKSARTVKTRSVRPSNNANSVFKIPHFEIGSMEYNYDGIIVREPAEPRESAAPRRDPQVNSDTDALNRTADSIFKVDDQMLETHSHEEEEDRYRNLVSFPI